MSPSTRKPLVLDAETLESRFADAYRALRVTVFTPNGTRPPISVLVASAKPGEGRSTTVVNLGIVAGQAGSRVVLVDADLRNPSLHTILEQGPASPPGLAEMIRGGGVAENLILQTPFSGVWLLPAGADRERPSELVTSPRMGEVIAALRQQADLVLLDSPACGQHVDAVELAAHVEGLLYVVRAGDQDEAMHRQVRAQLLHAKARMLGVVLNSA